MADNLIELCKLYENTSKKTGKKYYSGTYTFTTRLVLLQNDRAKEGEPGWTLFISDREPKVQAGNFGGTPGDDSSMERRKTA